MLRSPEETPMRPRCEWTAAVLAVLLIAGAAGSSAHAAAAAGSANAALANGKAIFLTGRDLAGAQIAARPRALMPSCAACHRANGSGGLRLPGGVVSADLRHRALVTEQKPPYNVTLLERAISGGIDNSGHRLEPVMPRWRMSKRDLHDVAEYVLTALK